MDVECYNEKEFKVKHSKVYMDFVLVAQKYGIDLDKYYFGQLTKYEESVEVTYNHSLDENVCFTVEWWKGNIESVLLSMD